jgi:hypothetical protein
VKELMEHDRVLRIGHHVHTPAASWSRHMAAS